MSKKVLKNKQKITSRAMITGLIIGGSVFTVAGLAGFVNSNKQYNDLQKQSDEIVNSVTATSEYTEYKNTRESYYYDLYKNGEISAAEFESSVDALSTSEHIIKEGVACVSDEVKDELKNIEKQKFNRGLDAFAELVCFVGGGAVAMAALAATSIKDEEELLK